MTLKNFARPSYRLCTSDFSPWSRFSSTRSTEHSRPEHKPFVPYRPSEDPNFQPPSLLGARAREGVAGRHVTAPEEAAMAAAAMAAAATGAAKAPRKRRAIYQGPCIVYMLTRDQINDDLRHFGISLPSQPVMTGRPGRPPKR